MPGAGLEHCSSLALHFHLRHNNGYMFILSHNMHPSQIMYHKKTASDTCSLIEYDCR